MTEYGASEDAATIESQNNQAAGVAGCPILKTVFILWGTSMTNNTKLSRAAAAC